MNAPPAGQEGSARSPTAPLRRGLPDAAVRLVAPVVFGALPLAAVVGMLVVALTTGPLALDFSKELYPQAKQILAGENPYPHAVWPPLAVLVAAPLTVLPVKAAGIVVAIAGLGCMVLALRLTGVTDWRVYGAVGLWPPVLTDVRIAHLTPLLCLLLAVVWRYRETALVSGAALGLAVGLKLFLWPVGVWLLATRRAGAALVGVLVAAASILLVLPLTSIGDYTGALRHVSETFDQDGYTVFGALTRLGTSDAVARMATVGVGSILLILVWRLRSFAIAVGAALVLSPIVWLDFFSLTAIPLGIVRPRIGVVWLLPLATWGLPSAGIATDLMWGVTRVLVVFAAVLIVAARAETQETGSRWFAR